MADAERLQPLHLAPETGCQLRQGHQRFRLQQRDAALTVEPLLRQPVELLMQGGEMLCPHRESTRCRMAAMALQQGAALLQRRIHGKASGRPY